MEGDEVVSPEKLSEIYSSVYPEKMAAQQLKQMGKSQSGQWVRDPSRPGWRMNKVTGEYKQDKEVTESMDPYKQSQIDARKARTKQGAARIAMSDKQYNLAVKNQDWKQATKILDNNFRERNLFEQQTRREQTEKWRREKSPFEYAQLQGQLKGQMPSILQGAYRGTSSEAADGQDLTGETVKKLTAATEGVSQLLSNTDELLGMIEEHGLEYAPSQTQAKMKTILSNITLQYKGEEFAGLGVLAGPDMEILLEATGNPTQFSLLSAADQMAKMKQFRKGLIEGYNKKLMSRGFDTVDIGKLQSMGNVAGPPSARELTAEEEAAL
jgi:hypothetical protein